MLPLLNYHWGRRFGHRITVLGRAHTGIGNVVRFLLAVDRDQHSVDQLGAQVRASVIHDPTPATIFNTSDVPYRLGHPVLHDVIMHCVRTQGQVHSLFQMHSLVQMHSTAIPMLPAMVRRPLSVCHSTFPR